MRKSACVCRSTASAVNGILPLTAVRNTTHTKCQKALQSTLRVLLLSTSYCPAKLALQRIFYSMSISTRVSCAC